MVFKKIYHIFTETFSARLDMHSFFIIYYCSHIYEIKLIIVVEILCFTFKINDLKNFIFFQLV